MAFGGVSTEQPIDAILARISMENIFNYGASRTKSLRQGPAPYKPGRVWS